VACANYFRESILRRKPDHRLKDEGHWARHQEKWAEALDKLHRIDKRSWEDIRRVIDLIEADVGLGEDFDGWGTTCWSPANLRKKWDKITAQLPRRRRTEPELMAHHQGRLEIP
jgi:hypothetical protein